jgi:hypothetical protein
VPHNDANCGIGALAAKAEGRHSAASRATKGNVTGWDARCTY